ncbi:MAG: AI-2E family transporter [Bdellovibrionales bacterium]
MIPLSASRNRLRRLNFFRISFFLLIFSFLLTALFIINGLFITLLLAFIINFVLLPPVNQLCKLGISRNASTSLVFLTSLTFLVSLIVWSLPFLSQQFLNLKYEFPNYIQKTTLLITLWQENLETHFSFMKSIDLSSNLETFLRSLGTAFLQDLPSTLTQSFTILLMAPFFAFFMVKNERGLTRYLYPLVPNQIFEMFLGLHYKISHQIGIFIRGRLLEALAVGFIVGTSLVIFDFPFPILLAGFSALANLIPYVGPFVASIVIFLVALVNDYETSRILIVLGIFYAAQVIDSMVLVPIFLARTVNLHPLTVIVILIAGAQFMGILGMVISIPLASALKVSVMAVYQHVSDNI